MASRAMAAPENAPPPPGASAPPRLSFACVLERHYSMALESTLQAAGLDDEEIAFVNCVEPTEEDVASGLPLADRHWAAQHVSEWRRAAEREGPVLVFQSDVNLSAACGSVLKPLVAAAEEMSTPLVAAPEERVLLMYLGAAGRAAAAEQAGGAQAGAPCAEVGEHALLAVQSACLTDTYVLWPAAARRLLKALPVDRPVAAFLSEHVARKLAVSPPLASVVQQAMQ